MLWSSTAFRVHELTGRCIYTSEHRICMYMHSTRYAFKFKRASKHQEFRSAIERSSQTRVQLSSCFLKNVILL